MGEDATQPTPRKAQKARKADVVPPVSPAASTPPTGKVPRGKTLGDTSLRFEPPPQEAPPANAPQVAPRPRTPAATTPFTPAQPTQATTPFRAETAPEQVRPADPAKTTPAKTTAPEGKAPTKKAAAKQAPAKKVPAKKVPAEAAGAGGSEQLELLAKAEPVVEPVAVKKAAKKAAAKKVAAKKVAPAVTAPVNEAVVKKAAVKKAATNKAAAAPIADVPARATAPTGQGPAPAAESTPETVPTEPTMPAAEVAPSHEPAPAVRVAPVEEAVPAEHVAAVEAAVPVGQVAADGDVDAGVVEAAVGAGRAGINPAYLPEVLALAAVQRLGEGARRRVEWYTVRYPDADGDAVSRAIAREFVRRARRQGFAAGVAGTVGLLIEAAGVNWLQAKLVLQLAAAYGHDPLDRRRAAELLVLQRVHGSVETAEAAIRAAEQESNTRRAGRAVGVSRVSGPLARTVGAGLVQAALVRFAKRLVPGPGVGAVLGSVAAARSTEMLAARAIRYYRRR